jgi:2-epi-5-epi-valiolone synthase
VQSGTDVSSAPLIDMRGDLASCARYTYSLQCSRTEGFEVEFARNLAGRLRSLEPVRRALVVMSPTVRRIYGTQVQQLLNDHGIEFSVCVVAMGERRKTLKTLTRICTQAARLHLGRRDMFIAVGGGVCTDLVGMAAAMYRRGIAHLRIPTTLIGQVDAGIGIKGGINFHGQKNLLGCFHPPCAVIVHTGFLRTLEAVHIRQGIAEILKMALIVEPRLFDAIERHGSSLIESRFQEPQALGRWIVKRSISLMLEQLQRNPYENITLQRLVDMGHTFSPALESASGFHLSHGEAVAVDMALSCMIAEALGLLRRGEAERFVALLWQLGIPACSTLLTVDLCRAAARAAIAHRGGKLHLVVPTRIGAAQFVENEDVTEPVLLTALGRLRELLADLVARSDRFTGRAARGMPDASPIL